MRALDRKLLRDLRLMWSQALTIALVVASGIGGFITTLSAVGVRAAPGVFKMMMGKVGAGFENLASDWLLKYPLAGTFNNPSTSY